MTILTVSNKGCIVLPAKLRRKYNLTPGTKIHLVDYGGILALVPTLENPVEQAAGMLKGSSSLTDALLKKHTQELSDKR